MKPYEALRSPMSLSLYKASFILVRAGVMLHQLLLGTCQQPLSTEALAQEAPCTENFKIRTVPFLFYGFRIGLSFDRVIKIQNFRCRGIQNAQMEDIAAFQNNTEHLSA